MKHTKKKPTRHHGKSHKMSADDDKKESILPLKVWIILVAIMIVIGIWLLIYFNNHRIRTGAEILDHPYSDDVGAALEKMSGQPGTGSERPDYLPEDMFERLPEMPKDFYQVRSLIRSGRLTDLENLEPEYWQQPEFFPHFEDIGVPLLSNPPEGRWGAYGLATFPADTVVAIRQGETLNTYFMIKSSYLVETYQGINLEPTYKDEIVIQSGFSMPDGSKTIEQDPAKVKEYFTVTLDPDPFVLYPNYPKYNINGTKKVRVTISASPETPPGNYVIGLDTAEVPDEYEQRWLREYLNLYTSGGLTKIDRPYFQAFVEVIE